MCSDIMMHTYRTGLKECDAIKVHKGLDEPKTAKYGSIFFILQVLMLFLYLPEALLQTLFQNDRKHSK